MKKKQRNNVSKVGISFIIVAFAMFAVFGLALFTQNPKDGNVKTSEASSQEPADINNDNKVDGIDLSMLLVKWGTTDAVADINNDGSVGSIDLSILLGKWGTIVVVSTKPDATNTGVPNGVTLRSVSTAYPDATAKGYSINAQGTVTISKDGEVYDGISFPDGVRIRAKNVIIRNSRIVAGRTSFSGLIAEPTSWADCRTKTLEVSGQNPPSVFVLDANASSVVNFLLEDSEIAVDDHSVYISGFMGRETTMTRVDISGGVDGIGAYSGSSGTAAAANFTLQDSYVHDLFKGTWSPANYNTNPTTGAKVYCGYDASHPEGTHNDGIQLHGGTGVYVLRSSLMVNASNATQTNAGIMMNSGGNIHVEDSHFQYGTCSINIVSGLGAPVSVINNTFYGNNGANATGTMGTGSGNCAIIRPSSNSYTFTNNLWANGVVVTMTNGN